jgi:hypothetical protein
MGWTPASPKPFCPVCRGTKFSLLPSGGVQCVSWVKATERVCNAQLYILHVARAHLAFVAEVTTDELIEMERQQLTIWQALQFLGAGFPFDTAA